MDENVVYMFDIPILDTGVMFDNLDDGTQYKVKEWYLKDMKKYTDKWALIGFAGEMKIYDDEGELLFDGTLLDSTDFVCKLKSKLK